MNMNMKRLFVTTVLVLIITFTGWSGLHLAIAIRSVHQVRVAVAIVYSHLGYTITTMDVPGEARLRESGQHHDGRGAIMMPLCHRWCPCDIQRKVGEVLGARGPPLPSHTDKEII
jgi:hypothetical protein